MEKNQQNNSNGSKEGQHNHDFTGNQAGQQPPADTSQTTGSSPVDPGKKEQHSESSFPQQDGETLGTP